MSNLPKKFNENGPVTVSEEDFQIFQSHNYGSIDEMYFAWQNENNRAGERRLCIRCILRQAYNGTNTENAFYNLGQGFGRIMFIGGGKVGEGDNLRFTLRNRPQLLEEFISEFLYNIEFECLPKRDLKGSNFVKLHEILLTVTTGDVLTELWRRHPFNTDKEFTSSALVDIAMRLYPKRKQMPQVLRDELWQVVAQLVPNAILLQWVRLQEIGHVTSLNYSGDDLKTISNFTYAMTQESAQPDVDIAMIERCMALLEDGLPQNVKYLNIVEIGPVLMKLNNLAIVTASLCRHIATYDPIELSNIELSFLCWARGIITLYNPITNVIEKLDQAIQNKAIYEPILT